MIGAIEQIRRIKANKNAKAVTYEFVSPKHPDKLCDQIADSILDAYLRKDRNARVAVEVMGGHGKIKVTGEITSRASVDIEHIAQNVVGNHYEIEVFTSNQSPEIARGVDNGGAGDQGIMVGYACSETATYMPKGYEMARQLCRGIYSIYPFDGKVQITLSGDNVLAVVASFQNSKNAILEEVVRNLVKAEKYFVNPAGEWITGSFDADSGLSGRKLVIDNYGPEVPIGGGSFSGKDLTKVDRSGAYMARKMAVDILTDRGAKEVLVKLAYVIGVAEPVMAVARVDGILEAISDYELTPKGIVKALDLNKPIYADTATWGHFGRGFRWDNNPLKALI